MFGKLLDLKFPDLTKRLDDLTDRIDLAAHQAAFFQGALVAVAVVALVFGAAALLLHMRRK